VITVHATTTGQEHLPGRRLPAGRLGRAAALVLAGALLFVLAGDRGITASYQGIDPLEILNLQVKPNVIIALDTSGSMEDTPYVASSYGGDHPRSKMWQAKQVLKAVFQANQTKASFLFGVYRYGSDPNPVPSVSNLGLQVNATPNRWVYATQSWAAGTYPNPACTVDPTTCPTPNPVNVTLGPEGPGASMVNTNLYLNSLYAYQWIQNSNTDVPYNKVRNNTLVFNENGGPTCTVQVTPRFYRTGQDLAVGIQSAMNTQCSGRLNSYSVNYGSRVLSVTTLTRSGTTATVTTSEPHNLLPGVTVTIAGAPTANPPNWNGSKTVVTVVNATQFTYTVTNGGPTTATGTMTATVGTANRFTFQGTGTTFYLQWNAAATTLDGPLNLYAAANQTVSGTAPAATGADPRINLLARATGNAGCSPGTNACWVETYDPDGPSTTVYPSLDHPSPTRAVYTYNLDAQKYWNGETVYVSSSGQACDIVPGTLTNPPTVTLQLTDDCSQGANAANAANKAVFTWGGGKVGTGSGTCQGFSSKVPLIPCDQTSPPQYDGIAPYLENQLALDTNGTLKTYAERTDGTGYVTTNPVAGGVTASGNTPLGQTADDVRVLFGGPSGLWHAGQAAAPGPPPVPALDPIKNHLAPKEKTILILVTDGNQNCSPFAGENAFAARGAAAATQRLYNPDVTANNGNGAGAGTVNADGTINGDPAASVTTYVIAYGAGASKNYSDWIAWGGSGMVRTITSNSWPSTDPTQADRDKCKTCVDSFLAPDADTLKIVLEKVINQGASSGEFTAQQSLTDSIYELAGDVPKGDAPLPWSPMNPRNRYDPLVPHRFSSTFTLPLFTGQIRAYTQGGPASLATTDADCAYTVVNVGGSDVIQGNACQRWSANDKLVKRVSNGMTAACPAASAAGVAAGQCNFKKLWAGASDSGIATSTAAIKRRIYTTSQNGVFGPTVDELIAGQSPYRIALWPPQTASISTPVAPASNTAQGLFDAELGLPLDGVADASAAFLDLRTKFRACMGASLPTACPAMTATTGTLDQMQRARREAREMILAFLAGAQFVPDSTTGYPKRATAASGDYAAGDILFGARAQILAESTLATSAVVSPPQEEEPEATPWKTEYELYRDGPRLADENPGDASQIRAGFGLRNPDKDKTNVVAGTARGRVFYQNDSRLGLKPVMSVLYAGTNSALHAFRAGPSVATQITTACTDAPLSEYPPMTRECGGEELWAFVPYDQLGKLMSRYLNNPQKRDPHDYMIARAIRYSDVFVPNPGTADDPRTTPVPKTVSGVPVSVQGVWRKVMLFGRGAGGKFMTAIDVTAPGPFTDMSLGTTGPIVLWNRGNPDTNNGKLQASGGTPNHDTGDYDAYLKMGETWSVPAVAYMNRDTRRPDDPARRSTATARKPAGVDFVAYVGSGYAKTGSGEGTAFYSLDPLTGDVITSVDVDETVESSYSELKRSGMAYDNAIVANPVVFNPSRYIYMPGGVPSPNVAAATATRVYVGDLYGRVWKFLTAAPDLALPVADLGADQPVATAASLIGFPPNTLDTVPHVYVTTGNDSRATVSSTRPWGNFGFKDGGDNVTYAVSPPVTKNGIKVYPPMDLAQDSDGNSSYPVWYEKAFRGTVQPTTTYSDDTAGPAGQVLGRVFFAGTRFNGPNSEFAPPVPPYPCRSSFDSILYGLGAKTGEAAYSIGAYKIFQDSRIVGQPTQASPGEAVLAIDEGLSKGGPKKAPPQLGLAPTTQATTNVVVVSGPGLPQPTVRFGSTVCQ
jgi:hypothetical protein